MLKKRECMIKDKVKIICSFCGTMFEIPMCKAVNGEDIICQHCQKIINFVHKY